MSRRITAGNDAPFIWAVKLQGKPFDLSGKDVKVYVINSRGEIPVAQLTIEGHEVSGVFEGRYQTRLGEHSLVLRVNEGRPEMKTAAVANVFELVQWSADAGGSDEGDVIVAPVLIESELSIGGGRSYDDTEVKNELARLEREKADKSELTELSTEVSELSEKVDNLPTAESDVFVAEYGKTTFAEVATAHNAGKVVVAIYNNEWVCTLERAQSSQFIFSAQAYPNIVRLICGNTDNWTYGSFSADHDLTKLDNGNVRIKITNQIAEVATPQYVENAIQQSGGGGMTTPSGDPMHYMFEAVGATYNATDADIPMVGVYGDSYVHKAHHWHLNELGDITNEEMRQIYAESQPMVRRIYLENAFSGSTIRTNIPIWDANRSTSHGSIALTNNELRGGFCESKLEVFAFIIGPMSNNIQKHLPFSASALSRAFRNASKLSKIIGCLNCSSVTDYQTFVGTTSLKEVRLIRLKNSFSFSDSPLLSKDSVLFAIQNSEATGAITITLHADAYARLAEDADIVAALADKTNVSLAK